MAHRSHIPSRSQPIPRSGLLVRFIKQLTQQVIECSHGHPVAIAWARDLVCVPVVGEHVELGGTEQLFTFMLARDFQREAGLPQQIGVMSPILVGLDGKRRMGKSLGNYIGISEPPYEMMKKFMQIPDNVMRMYFELLTTIPIHEIDTLLSGHPKEAKVRLACLVIAEYHTAAVAEDAAARWQKEIGSSGALPSEIPQVNLILNSSELDADGCIKAAFLLKELKLVSSTSEATRRIQGNAVFVIRDGVKERVTDRSELIRVESGMIVRAGKKDWAKVSCEFVDQE